MVKNIVTPWSFRDGKEYIVSLGVGDNPKNVSISISNKITAEEWSCNHDCKYIENLTQKTGSYKAFDTFISMIKSAILKKSDAVTLDLMTSEDLEAIKHQKLQSEVVLRAQVGSPTSNFTNFQAQPKLFGSQKNRNLQEEDKRRYLIVSYIAEFDRVHYPVPLNYSGPPDPFIMQSNILKLQSEVTHLRTAKSNLEKKLSHGGHAKKPQNPCIDFKSLVTLKEVESMYETDDTVSLVGSNRLKNHNANSHKKSLEAENDDRMKKGDGVQNAESETRETHQFQQTLERVFAVVHNLEQKIFEERAKMKKLQAENDSLRSKLSDYRDSDKELRLRIKNLESLQANKLRRGSSEDHYHIMKRTGTYTILNDKEYKRNSRSDMMKLVDGVYNSHLNIRSSSTERKAKGPLERDPPRCQRSRCNSVDSNVSCTSKSSNNNSVPRNPGSRSVSPAGRSPVFNPTAYVNEKKRKQEHMAQLRLSRIQARINSRSASREKIKLQDSPRSLQFTNYSPSTCSVCDEEPFNASSNDRIGCPRSHHRKVNNQARRQVQSAKFPNETNKSVNNRRNSPSPARNEKVNINNSRNRGGRSPERKAPISNITWKKSTKTDAKETTHKSINNHPNITNKTNNHNLLTRNYSATNCNQNQQRRKNSTRGVTSGWAEWAMPTVKVSRLGI